MYTLQKLYIYFENNMEPFIRKNGDGGFYCVFLTQKLQLLQKHARSFVVIIIHERNT